MPITPDQLVEGGPVFFTMYRKSGPTAGRRRLPARVLDIQGESATIELLHDNSVREVKFQHLEPDLDWLSKLYEERNRAERKRLAKQAEYAVIGTPVLDPRTPLPLPEPKAAPDPQAHLFKEAEPVNYEKVPDVPQITMSEPPSLGELVEQQVADHAAADLAAYLEMGDSLLKRIDAAVEDTERKLLEERREAILRRMTTLKKEGERMAKKDARIRSPEMRERALKDIRAGMSSRKVAEKHKISTGTVWIWKNADQAAQAATKAAEKTAGGGARPGRFTTAYPDEKRHAVLADVEAGMRVMEAAEKHGVHPSTIHYWKKGGGGHKPGPKPGFKAKAEPVAEVPAKPEAPKPSLTKAQEENRRLRTALAKLLAQEPTSGDVVALAEDNRRLRLIIDMWLGLS